MPFKVEIIEDIVDYQKDPPGPVNLCQFCCDLEEHLTVPLHVCIFLNYGYGPSRLDEDDLSSKIDLVQSVFNEYLPNGMNGWMCSICLGRTKSPLYELLSGISHSVAVGHRAC